MTNGSGAVEQQAQEIVIDENSPAVIVRGGIRVAFNASGGIDVYGNVPVMLHPPVNDDAKPAPAMQASAKPIDPQIGDVQTDGTKFAGISPDTGKPMYARPVDEPNTMKWKRAMDYAARFKGHGHSPGTFRAPSKEELNVLFQNRAQIGGFNETGSGSAGWYWSSTEHNDDARYAWGQRFDGRNRAWGPKSGGSSLRLVRS